MEKQNSTQNQNKPDNRGGNRPPFGGGNRRGRGPQPPRPQSEYEQKVLDIARVARVTAGGRRFRFRATVAIGNKKGKVGIGVAKGKDVSLAIEKSVRFAKKNLITAPMTPDGSIPYDSTGKQTSAVVFLKPSRQGRGIVAGGAVRVVCDLAGFKDITGKIMGKSGNKLNNALATIAALENIRYTPPVAVKSVKKATSAKDSGVPKDDKKVLKNSKSKTTKS